jgi:hypothetical protein
MRPTAHKSQNETGDDAFQTGFNPVEDASDAKHRRRETGKALRSDPATTDGAQ